MSSILLYSVITLTLAIISALVLYYTTRSQLAGISLVLEKFKGSSLTSIQKFDAAIEGAFTYLAGRYPLHAKLQLESDIAQTSKSASDELALILELGEKLKAAQAEMDEREAKQNALRAGREEASLLADELRAKKEEQTAGHQRLQSQLSSSRAQMELLSSEVSLTSAQQGAFKEVSSTLDKVADRLRDLVEVHTQASQRFLNLQQQYEELEKEYRKLIDIEISGK